MTLLIDERDHAEPEPPVDASAPPDEPEPILLVDHSPTNGAVDVPVNTMIFAQYNRPVWNAYQIRITSQDGAQAADLYTTSATSSARAWSNPRQLRPYTTYTVQIDGRIVMDPDDHDVHLSGSSSWTFTTGADTLPPVLLNQLWTNVCADPFQFTLLFDEPVANVGSATIHVTNGGVEVLGYRLANEYGEVTFHPNTTAGLDGATLLVTVSGLTDRSGNVLADTHQWTLLPSNQFCALDDDWW